MATTTKNKPATTSKNGAPDSAEKVITTKIGVCVGSVPEVTGTDFLAASEPAMARTGTMSQNLEKNMHRPRAVL